MFEYVSDDYIIGPFFQITYVPISYKFYLYQHFIDFRINKEVNTSKHKNGKMYITSEKCIHNTGQNCITKCTTKCTTCSTITFIEKLVLLCVLILLNRQKTKVYILNGVLKLLVERFH